MKLFYQNIIIKFILYYFSVGSWVVSQLYTSADPYYLLLNEKGQFEAGNNFHSTVMRPFFKPNGNRFHFSYKNEYYINDNSPNQENMDVRYFGKGVGVFTSAKIAYLGKFISYSFEPFILTNQNRDVEIFDKPAPYNKLNDVVQNQGNKFSRSGLKETQFYLHYKGLGIGYSNANMWWGPGIQGSLAMTNNTVGFPHYSFGTIRELRWRNWGLWGRYIFSTIKENTNVDDTYFTALAAAITYYSNPVITIGITRNYLTGGVDMGTPWTAKDAARIIFEDFFIENLRSEKYTYPSGHDPFDQTLTSFLSMMFPSSKLKLYLELGFNDNRMNFWDFVIHPDHSIATIIGFQKYGIFGNNNLLLGFEYASLVNSRMQVFRGFPPWYERSHYDDWSYESRRWGTHSGSDSDDLLIFFGWMNDKWSFVPAFNYERHGITTYRPPEVKMEIRINAHYKINNSLRIGVYFENQYEAHLGFPNDHYWLEVSGKRYTNTFIIRLEKVFEH